MDPQEFAAKLNWEGRKIYWGVQPPNSPVIPTLSMFNMKICSAVSSFS